MRSGTSPEIKSSRLGPVSRDSVNFDPDEEPEDEGVATVARHRVNGERGGRNILSRADIV